MVRVCSARCGTPAEATGGAVRGDGRVVVAGAGVGVAERLFVERTCTVLQGAEDGESRSLSSRRGREAYVLLGAPGAGKTVAFKREAAAAGGCFVRARDFITYADRPEWHGGTLFIDGLDEKRAGSADRRTPLDAIRAKLFALGSPRFRLSCREADWFGAPDRTSLSSAAPGTSVDVLRLDPLTDDDVRAILRHRGVGDVDGFLATARRHGVESWMRNPQALEMLVEAMGDGAWPATRRETFERGCRALGRERNPEHRLASAQRPSREEVLATAGRLCAVLLLTGEAEYAVDDDGAGGLLPLTAFEEPGQERIGGVCRTLLFEVQDGRVAPRHRHVAEFLGGRYLAGLVDGTLPVGRVLAHLTGFDGGVASELRGLAAWLAAFSVKARAEIIERDPLGVVLYGDVKGFSRAEKKAMIRGLEGVAAEDPASLTQYRETDARWGDLATEDIAPVFAAALAEAGADSARAAVAVVVLESLANGARVPGMAPLLLEAVRDEERTPAIRELALKAYLNQSDDEAVKVTLAKDIVAGALAIRATTCSAGCCGTSIPASSTRRRWRLLHGADGPEFGLARALLAVGAAARVEPGTARDRDGRPAGDGAVRGCGGPARRRAVPGAVAAGPAAVGVAEARRAGRRKGVRLARGDRSVEPHGRGGAHPGLVRGQSGDVPGGVPDERGTRSGSGLAAQRGPAADDVDPAAGGVRRMVRRPGGRRDGRPVGGPLRRQGCRALGRRAVVGRDRGPLRAATAARGGVQAGVGGTSGTERVDAGAGAGDGERVDASQAAGVARRGRCAGAGARGEPG